MIDCMARGAAVRWGRGLSPDVHRTCDLLPSPRRRARVCRRDIWHARSGIGPRSGILTTVRCCGAAFPICLTRLLSPLCAHTTRCPPPHAQCRPPETRAVLLCYTQCPCLPNSCPLLGDPHASPVHVFLTGSMSMLGITSSGPRVKSRSARPSSRPGRRDGSARHAAAWTS